MASIHHQGLKGLACATISQALKNMRRTGSPSEDDYVDAVVWLGSSRAMRFFDTAGISQGPALLAMGWSPHAAELCRRLNGDVTPRERHVLEESLRAVEGQMRPNGANWEKTTSQDRI